MRKVNERLTLSVETIRGNGRYYVFDTTMDEGYAIAMALKKLGAIEDAEERLGVDFLTIAKAMTDGLYRKGPDGEIEKFYVFQITNGIAGFDLGIDIFKGIKYCANRAEDDVYVTDEKYVWDPRSNPEAERKGLFKPYGHYYVSFDDFGDDLALTKEELEERR